MSERITARVVLLNEKNELLFIKGTKSNGLAFWFTPGGKVEDGETLLVAAQRELHEETGIHTVDFTTPHSWYNEVVINFNGAPTFFKEHFFLACVTVHTNIDPVSNQETEYSSHMQWWDLNAFISRGEQFWPAVLLKELNSVVYCGHIPQGTCII